LINVREHNHTHTTHAATAHARWQAWTPTSSSRACYRRKRTRPPPRRCVVINSFVVCNVRRQTNGTLLTLSLLLTGLPISHLLLLRLFSHHLSSPSRPLYRNRDPHPSTAPAKPNPHLSLLASPHLLASPPTLTLILSSPVSLNPDTATATPPSHTPPLVSTPTGSGSRAAAATATAAAPPELASDATDVQ
jgi:hypothetical protein